METKLSIHGHTSSTLMKITRLLQFLIFVITIPIFAQSSGTIKGVVVDKDFGDGLFGANVFIEGTTRGAATDINGEYSISGIDAGIYTISYSMIGYQKQVVTNVELKPGEIKKIDIILGTETYETEEVVISAKAVTNTEASLLAKRQKSVAVSDAISAEEISKSGSGDAASAMKKVTGASVVGGKYVLIRGLGETGLKLSLLINPDHLQVDGLM